MSKILFLSDTLSLRFSALSVLVLLTLLLTTCSSKWDHSDPGMPADLIEYNQNILDDELAILKENPEDLNALFEVAFRYQQLGDWGKAVNYYEKVLDQAPADFATVNNLAYIYEEMEDYYVAAEYIKRLYEANPSNIEVINDTVRILLEADDALNAEHALQNFAKLKIDPENPDADMQALIDELYEDISTWKSENE